MTIHEAQQNFDALPTAVQEGPVMITRRRKPVLVAMAHSHFDSLMEMLDILSDRAFFHHLAKGIQDGQEGKVVSAAEVRRRLGL